MHGASHGIKSVNYKQLTSCGMKPLNIHVNTRCTEVEEMEPATWVLMDSYKFNDY